MFTHIDDFVLRRPLFWLFRGPVEQPLAVEVSLLLRPQSETSPFLNISVAVQKTRPYNRLH